MSKRSSLKTTQAALLNLPVERDIVYTPRWLSKYLIETLDPSGKCLDPCSGVGAFLDYLPAGSDWAEIEKGRDFFKVNTHYDWIIGNPPYECWLGWVRHSCLIADNVAFLVPLHRVMSSGTFINDTLNYGGMKTIIFVGTGTTAGFPFGHSLGMVHYQRNYLGDTKWIRMGKQ